MIEHFDNELNPDILILMIQAVMELELKDASEKLKNLLDNDDDRIKQRAYYALGKFESIDEEIEKKAIAELDSKNYIIMKTAIYYLSKIKSNKAIEKLKELLLTDYTLEADMKQCIIKAFGDIGNKEIIDFLIEQYNRESYTVMTKSFFLYSFGELNADKAIPILKEAIFHDNMRMREQAVLALGKIDSKESGKYLKQALKDDNMKVRITAIESIKNKEFSDKLLILKYLAKKDPEFRVKEAAISALFEIGGADIQTWVKEIIESKNIGLTNIILKYIHKLPTEFAVEIINNEYDKTKLFNVRKQLLISYKLMGKKLQLYFLKK